VVDGQFQKPIEVLAEERQNVQWHRYRQILLYGRVRHSHRKQPQPYDIRMQRCSKRNQMPVSIPLQRDN
jgi:hypothetical protein